MLSFIKKSIVRVFNSVVLAGIIIGLAVFSMVIGAYNYNTSIKDLRAKTSNTSNLTSISLMTPLWNYDDAALQGILNAILLDPDVVAIRLTKGKTQEVIAEKKRKSAEKTEFAALLKNPEYINTLARIDHEGEQIGQIQIISSTERVMAVIRNTTVLIFIFALMFVLIIGGFILFLGTRIIQRPINALRESADHLAGGNLDQTINTDRQDELGSLAVSFDKMRNAIRKKLADLAILNSTGEKLAGIHDQSNALETAIKVMTEQTRVERGSIYLLNPEKTLTLKAFFPELNDHPPAFQSSFNLGEGIVGKVATTGEIQFLPDVSKVPDYVSAGPNTAPKALLCVPMMDDQELFGVMNFVGEVGKVNFSKEDEGFALTIARMVVITIKNIQMLAVIEEQNRTLEERILARTAELRQKTNDVNNMLQNMRQGIFTITAGGMMHHEYSAYLAQIFETDDIANQPALPFLFDSSNVGSDVLSQMEAALDSVIGEDGMMFDFNSHLLINEYTKQFGDRSKSIELDWNAVLDSEGVLDKLMVTVRDVTEFKALQMAAEKQKEELDIIGQILSVSMEKLLSFVATSYEFFDENKKLIESNSDKNAEAIAILFRNMHTIKGNSRTYGLTYITDSIHEAETTYSLLRSDEEFAWNSEQLLEQLQTARQSVARYEAIFKEKLSGFSTNQNDAVTQSIIEKIAAAVSAVNELSQPDVLRNSLISVQQSVTMAHSVSIFSVLDGILDGMPSLSSQLGKEVPIVSIHDHAIRLKKEIVPLVGNVFMHVFRNSMDHGLETTEQRLAQEKTAQGHINLDLNIHEDHATFVFEDDGKGLALGVIHAKAIANGQLNANESVTDEQIAELVFLSGLTTAESVTDISGRGVGMDAIRGFLNDYGGDIQLVFTEDSARNGFRHFKQVITLPAKYFVQ